MATLEEILAEVGLGESSQTKTASAAAPSTKEVNEVLENLGLNEKVVEAEGVTKTASDERTSMGLTDLYENIFGSNGETAAAAPAAEAGAEKTAAATAEAAPAGEVSDEPSTNLGELTGIYFNVMHDACIEKIAGDLEMEAGSGYKPQEHAGSTGELSRIVGQEGDPAVPNNYDASSGAGLKANPGNQTPYSLKAQAQIKAILKRRTKMEPGDVGGYNE